MKVNISYSVDIEDVLENLFRLFSAQHGKIEKELAAANRVLGNLENYKDEKISDLAQTIMQCKENIATYDIKLSEIMNILNGYYGLRYNPPDDGDIEDDVAPTEMETKKES